jgi:RNA polymerase sigma-70 factor
MMTETEDQAIEAAIDRIYRRCAENAPNFGVTAERFGASLRHSLDRFRSAGTEMPGAEEQIGFLEQIQADDLFLAIACADGNERAWWEFDHTYRSYIERVARHLAKTDLDAQEVADAVYSELYGTRVVDGERLSKFRSYSGRGSLRGWLRTVVWHSLVDLHRRGHDEVSLDELTESVGEGTAHAAFAEPAPGGESEMLDQLARERYRPATVGAMEAAFAALDDHEKLLLLLYHVEELKLREIARLAEQETSPLRVWFQRKGSGGSGRVYESTIMRWLEKCYWRVLEHFRSELGTRKRLSEDEIQLCIGLATQDLAGTDIFRDLKKA